MSNNVATADFYLKYDHIKENLIILVNKLEVNQNIIPIMKASLNFTLLPNKISMSTGRKIKHKNSLYFIFDESLTFKKLEAAQIGIMGLTVELFSHHSIMKSSKIADEYQALDKLSLTSIVERILLRLTTEQVNYMEEHEKQKLRLLNRQTSNVSSGSVLSQDPKIAVTFKLHSTISRLDVYIHRVARINLFVSSGYITTGFFAFGSKMVSTLTSERINFSNDNLLHISMSLGTKDADMKESGVCIQIIPHSKKDLQVNSLKYHENNGVLYVIFSQEMFTSITSKLAWSNFSNNLIDFNNRWHTFIVGSLVI